MYNIYVRRLPQYIFQLTLTILMMRKINDIYKKKSIRLITPKMSI